MLKRLATSTAPLQPFNWRLQLKLLARDVPVLAELSNCMAPISFIFIFKSLVHLILENAPQMICLPLFIAQHHQTQSAASSF